MKFVFLFLTILITLIASYFTVTQIEKFELIQKTRINTDKTNIVVSVNVDKAIKDIQDEEPKLEEALKALAVSKSVITTLKDDNVSIENQLIDLDKKIGEQDVKLIEFKNVYEGVKQELAQINLEVTLSTLNDDFKNLATSIEGKQGKEKGLEESIANEEKRLADKRAEIDRYNGRIQARDLRIAQNEIEARVTAVNHDWGFLVIGAGSNSGFMPDTRLLIKREGRLIGTVKPSAIELTQTIADIDFDSLSSGVRFQPGDEVIIAKPAPN
jgi:predicted  nucleic acid-binding Zn-ribbon protein